MSFTFTDPTKTDALAQAADARTRRATGDLTVTEDEAAAVAATYGELKAGGICALDALLTLGIERRAEDEKYR